MSISTGGKHSRNMVDTSGLQVCSALFMLCNLGPCPRPVRGGIVVVWAVRVWARWYIYDICMFPYFELRGAALFPIRITARVLVIITRLIRRMLTAAALHVSSP